MLDPGASGYVDFGSAAAIDNMWDGGGTVSMWFDAPSSFAFTYFMSKQGSSSTGWAMWHTGSGLIGFDSHSTTGYQYWQTTSDAMATSTLQNIVIEWNANDLSTAPLCYLDGALTDMSQIGGSGSGTRTTDAADSLYLAAGVGPSGYLDGPVGDVRFYSRQLSASDAAIISAARGRDRVLDGIVHRWLLRDAAPGVTASGSGGVKDWLGNTNGAASGSPTYAETLLGGP